MMTQHITVAELELGSVINVAPDTTLTEAARMLVATGAGTLVVESRPLAELTEHDLIAAVAREMPMDTAVASIARPPTQFVDGATTVDDVAAFMLATGRRTLVVARGGRPIGIAGCRSVMAGLLGPTSWLGAFGLALVHEGR